VGVSCEYFEGLKSYVLERKEKKKKSRIKKKERKKKKKKREGMLIKSQSSPSLLK